MNYDKAVFIVELTLSQLSRLRMICWFCPFWSRPIRCFPVFW